MDHRIIVELNATGTPEKTVPDISKTPTEPDKEKTSSTISVQSVISIAKNPAGALLGKVAQSVPIVATVLAVVAVGVQITSDSIAFSTMKSGDYGLQMGFNNLKTQTANFFAPISYGVNSAKQQTEADIFNKMQEYNRELMGIADINTYGKRRA